MGELIVLGVFAYCCAAVIFGELVDIVIDELLKRLPR